MLHFKNGEVIAFLQKDNFLFGRNVKNVEHSWLLWLSKTMVSVPEGSGFVKNWIEEGKICVLVFVPYKSVQI